MLFAGVFVFMFIFFAFAGMSWTSRIVCLSSIIYSISLMNNNDTYPFREPGYDELEQFMLMVTLFFMNIALLWIALWLGMQKRESKNHAEYKEKRKNCFLFFLKWGSIYAIFSTGLKFVIAYVSSLFVEGVSYKNISTISISYGSEILIFILFLVAVGIYKIIRNT